MKSFIGFAASLAVNFAILGALDLSVLEAQTPPPGQVSITQLPTEDGDLLAYAPTDSRPAVL